MLILTEMLAMSWGCIRFHLYLYGRKFICQTDHKPLEAIHLKYLSDAPPRLQRSFLKLQPYGMKLGAQTRMYWLDINKEIEDHVMHCETCQVLGRSQQKEPAFPMDIPSKPWQKLVMTYSFRIVCSMSLFQTIIQNILGYVSYQPRHLRM